MIGSPTFSWALWTVVPRSMTGRLDCAEERQRLRDHGELLWLVVMSAVGSLVRFNRSNKPASQHCR